VAIEVTCPSCTGRFSAPDNAAGKKAKCPKCGGVIAIPTAAPPPPPKDDIFDAEFEPQRPFTDEDFEVEAPAQIASTAATGAQKPCPMCGEMIQASAVKCRFCGEVFDPLLKKKAKRASKGGSDDDDLSTVDWVLAILCSGIGCIMGIVYLIQGKPKAGKMILISIVAGVFWNIVSAALQAIVEVNK
jgi:predicted RNA-binding Zn-ribbon protein involved in translation (DUF1610 family)